MLSIFKKSTVIDKSNELPNHARVWIYQSDRALTNQEVADIEQMGKKFVEEWKAHGKDLAASFKVLKHRFLILGVDEERGAASGCSIDSSVELIKNIEEKYQIDLMDKMNIAYQDSHGEIQVTRLSEFQELLENDQLTSETIVYNNLINSWGDLATKWEVPVKESWHKQLIR